MSSGVLQFQARSALLSMKLYVVVEVEDLAHLVVEALGTQALAVLDHPAEVMVVLDHPAEVMVVLDGRGRIVVQRRIWSKKMEKSDS